MFRLGRFGDSVPGRWASRETWGLVADMGSLLPSTAMSPTPFAENLRGIFALTACNLLFLINDTLIKLASEELP
jgi:hypothetical protein